MDGRPPRTFTLFLQPVDAFDVVVGKHLAKFVLAGTLSSTSDFDRVYLDDWVAPPAGGSVIEATFTDVHPDLAVFLGFPRRARPRRVSAFRRRRRAERRRGSR